ncbi:MAG: asparaginase [Gemmatimonadetes bacterium]|nr:asparaginase [Gemmatimonadota bacterium]
MRVERCFYGPLGFFAVGLLAMAAPVLAQSSDLPRVHVIATGGTIASSASGLIGVEQLLAGVPALRDVAQITFEQALRVGSSRVTPEDWLALAGRIDAVFRDDPQVAGVVVTHGTDSMEETAFFLDLVVGDARPVVVTGAMRSADAVGADGPANLLSAARVAGDPAARGRGVLVVMNDEVHEARFVVKAHTLRVQAFASPESGPVGTVEAEGVRFRRGSAPRPGPFDLSGVQALPEVGIDYSFIGAPGDALRRATESGMSGVVVAAFGSGRVSEGQAAEIGRALNEGVVVVLSSRVGSGLARDEYGGGLASGGRNVLSAGILNPQKARVLLMVALTQTRDMGELARIFLHYS